MIERAIALSVKNSLGPFHAHGLLLKGALSIKRGELETGVLIIRGSLETLFEFRYDLMHTIFLSALAEGLAMIGQFEEALATIDRAMAASRRHRRIVRHGRNPSDQGRNHGEFGALRSLQC
jgi:ATP/maltotriose-dependent transcriptional regulator MalT